MARFRGAGGRFVAKPQRVGIMLDSLSPGIALKVVELTAEVNLVMYRMSLKMEEWAKDNAPWQDRSGDARGGLTASFDESPGRPKIYIYHTIDYGLWLEIRWNGKFAIIMPTIEHFGHKLMLEIQAVI